MTARASTQAERLAALEAAAERALRCRVHPVDGLRAIAIARMVGTRPARRAAALFAQLVESDPPIAGRVLTTALHRGRFDDPEAADV